MKKHTNKLFTDYGIKVVSKNDKNKDAYCLNKAQVNVLVKAGISPSKKRPADSFNIKVIGDSNHKTVKATYYNAERAGSGRSAEPRLGTEIINNWLNIGDELLLATDGVDIFAMKLNNDVLADTEIETEVSSAFFSMSDADIIKRANTNRKASRKCTVSTQVYSRNPFVIEAAKRRAKGKCEMPGCDYVAFVNEKGVPYLEGHHIVPLSENGEDVLTNVAALCPICHRMQHHAKNKLEIRQVLKRAIINKN